MVTMGVKMETDKLLDALKTDHISNVLDQVADYNFAGYLNKLIADKGVKKSDLFNEAAIERSYGYQILKGRRLPSRNKVLALALSLKLSLAHLEVHLLLRLGEFEFGNRSGCLGGAHLVSAVHPVPYGDAYHHAHVPDAGELPCESVVHVRVCHEVSSREEHLRQIGSPGEFSCLAADVHGIGEEFQFGAIPVCRCWSRPAK